MQWWIRPGYSRCWAMRKPAPCIAEQRVARDPDVLVDDLGVVAVARRSCPYGCSIVATSRTIFTPGVSASTMNIDARWCGARVGIGHRHHDQEVGDRAVGGEPLVAVDHPVVAVADRAVFSSVGSEPAVSGSVMLNADFRSPASSGCR